MGDVSYAKSGRESDDDWERMVWRKNKMFVDVGEGLPTNAEISKIWEIRSVLLFRDNAGVFPDPESRESKIVCIFFPSPIWSLGVPPFDPGENS